MKVGHELGLDVTVAPAFSLVDAQNTSRDVFETQEQFEKELDMRYSARQAFHMDFCTMWQALGAAHHTLRKRFGSLVLVFLLSGFISAFAQNPVPFINQPLVPGAVAPGSPGFTLTVSGTGFALGATVNWNGTPLTTNFASSSQLTAVVLAGNILTAGTASVTVVNPGTSTASNVVSFSVVAPSSTVVYSNAPNSPINLGGTGATTKEPLSLAAGDFNGDGKLDLAVGVKDASSPGYVSILLGNGDGTFTPASSSTVTGNCPCALAVGDANGDGKPDLAVANSTDNTVTILLGKGDGTFSVAAGSPVSVGANPVGLAFGDFNGDQKLDLAVVNSDGNTLTILLGNGDGTFALASSPAAPGAPWGLVVGDFNGDGKLDLAVSNTLSNSVTVLLGNGDGSFTPAPSPLATSGFALAAGDFNSDGKLDLAVSNFPDSTVTILLGHGDGTFAPISGCCGTSVSPTRTFGLVAGDFNGDGKVDLALAILNLQTNVPLDYVNVLLGSGDGIFSTTNFSLLLPNDTPTIVAGDFNADGRLDFATASDPVNDISVLLQTPPSSPSPDFAVAASSTSISVPAGGTATYPLQVSSLNGFLGTVTLSCTGAPSLAKCSIPPPSSVFLFDGVFVSLNMSVTTAAPTAAATRGAAGPTQGPGPLGLWAVFLGLMFVSALIHVRGASPRTGAWAPLAAALMGVVFLAGCGGKSASPPPPSGTPPGKYTLTVTATSGSLSHSTTVMLIVN